MSPVIGVLHNLDRAFTGHAGTAIRAAGVELDERRLRAGEPLPSLSEVDGLLSLGGDQSVRDIARDPMLTAEAALLREAVEAGVPVFGVCLGAQLLAHALGGSVARLPRRMVQWAPITVLEAAHGDPVTGALPAGSVALHWNEDGFEPPPGAVELLARVGAGAEAFRYGDRAWGVQFHPEVTPDIVRDWAEDYESDPDAVAMGFDVDAHLAWAELRLPTWMELGRRFFDAFLATARAAAAQAAPEARSAPGPRPPRG
jgi:GMP synthase (glutamine-hydrolysing)